MRRWLGISKIPQGDPTEFVLYYEKIAAANKSLPRFSRNFMSTLFALNKSARTERLRTIR